MKRVTYQEIVQQVAKQINLPEEVVDKTYKSYWKFIKAMIEQLPLKEDISEEDLKKLRTSINVPSLGKLVFKEDKYKHLKKKFEKYAES